MSDFNSLFSGLGYSNGNSGSGDFLGISYTDYASIQNGSYRKLMNAYYANEKAAEAEEKGGKDTKLNLDAVSTAAGDLKNASAVLLNNGKDSLFVTKKDSAGHEYVDYDEDKVYKAAKEFINSYNDTLDAAAETDTISVLRDAKNMVSYTNANKKALAEIGITVGSDNKLSIDEDKFKNASKARVESVLHSRGGFVSQISAKATNIESHASIASEKAEKTGSTTKKNTFGLNSSSTSTSKDSTRTLAAIEEAAEDAQKTLSLLRKTGSKNIFNMIEKTDAAGNTVKEYDKDAIYDAVKNFIKDYNALMDKTEDSKTSDIARARRTMSNFVKANETALGKMGIRIDDDNKLSIDADKFKASDMAKVKSMFQGSGSLGAELEAQISKIDTYAGLQASKSNTYGGSGNYTYNYNSGDLYNSMI